MIGYLEMELDHEILRVAEWNVNFKKYDQIFDSHLRMKVTVLWSIPIIWEKPYICNVLRPWVTWVGVATHTYERDDLYLICSMYSRESACIVWL